MVIQEAHLKILITGFSGFVAYHFISFINDISDSNVRVLGLDRIIPPDFINWEFPRLDISFQECDLTNFEAVDRAILEFEPTHILHLAATSSVGQSWGDPSGCFKNNTGIFLNLAESLRQNALSTKMLCIGSSEEYGMVSPNDLPLRETKIVEPANPYAVAKNSQELMSRCYVNGYKMHICMTRSFNHIGPRQRDSFVVASFAKQFANAAIRGDPELTLVTGNLEVSRDFLDVRDVARAYYLLLDKGKTGELYNVCSGNQYSLSEIIKRLSEISGIRVRTITDESLIRPNDTGSIVGCNEKLIRDTGWAPSFQIDQTLQDIFSYWKETLSIA
jgi:GDP-4-dehydro-6-deoxy-D-mannose reductase